jgi:hypothetical protein
MVAHLIVCDLVMVHDTGSSPVLHFLQSNGYNELLTLLIVHIF